MSEVDWKDMFFRYVETVVGMEGVTLLGCGNWTAKEWEAITELTGCDKYGDLP